MNGNIGVIPYISGDDFAAAHLDVVRERRRERSAGPAAALLLFEKPRHLVLQRQQLLADGFRQRLEVSADFLADEPGHQPVEMRDGQLIQQCQRNGDGHTVERMGRLEAITQPELDAVHGQLFRELLLGDAHRVLAHQIFASHEQ